ncbi:MAG: NAD(P)H-binding protein, partial [Polyangia bacterium]
NPNIPSLRRFAPCARNEPVASLRFPAQVLRNHCPDPPECAVTASATRLRAFKDNPNYFSQGTGYIIAAMKHHGVSRLVVLSAFGTGESRRVANFIFDKLLISFLLKIPFQDHERQERMVRESGLDWVIVRPTRLTNGPARHSYVAKTTIERVPASIARADVAEFMLRATETDEWLRQAVQLGG